MTNFCTVADSNYLLKGLAMYNSLSTHLKEDFTLHWLCIDDGCFDSLINLWQHNDNKIHPYKLSAFENKSSELKIMKNNPATMYGDTYSNYCWSLTPWFIDYLLNNQLTASDEWLIYTDSDILFFKSPQLILDVITGHGYNGKDYSVGIHTHRFTKPYHEVDTGWYNVGVICFKNNSFGKQIAETWKGWLIDTSNPYYKTHGKTGDQKYLELFPQICGPEFVCVFDEGTNITHLAPWCADIEPNKEIVFFHFSHFRYYLKSDTWHDSLHGEWNPTKQPGIDQYYNLYFRYIKFASRQLVQKISIIGNIKIDTTHPERLKYLVACLRSFEFMKDYCEIIINFECPHPAIKLIQGIFYEEIGFKGKLYFTDCQNNYGQAYSYLLEQAKYDYVLNFIEDHFCVTSSIEGMQGILRTMRENEIEVMRASFHDIEDNSVHMVKEKKNTSFGYYFLNNENNFDEYCKYYGSRYFIGVNFLTTKEFSKRFWAREFDSTRPHDWEIVRYDPQFEHSVLVPSFPVLASIDDAHGEPGTDLLSRKDKKFEQIYSSI